MKQRCNTKDFGFNGGQFSMKKRHLHKRFAKENFGNSTILLYLIAAGLVMVLFAQSASAQFIVQPSAIALDPSPRSRYDGELKIHNYDPNQDITIEFKVLELTQQENGDWLPFSTDPCDDMDFYPGADMSKVSSCKSWVKLESTSVLVPAGGDASNRVIITTPVRTGVGFYGAAILAWTKIRESSAERIDTIVRMGIPVIANINTSTRASKVQIEDVGLEFVPSDGLIPGRVMATMKIKNTGVTFPSLNPIVRIRGNLDGRWKVITTHHFPDAGIIPGVELTLKSDIGKSLPSGDYQIDALLYVDGSIRGRGSRFGKGINFEGDPLVTRTATDVPLDLDPGEISIVANPGSTRYANLSVHNATDEQNEIQPVLAIPEAFKGKAENNMVVADAMTCLNWLTFEPANLKLLNFGTRNLQIAASMPPDALKYPYYYALLGLKAIYPDGQPAGTSWVKVCVENKNATAEPSVVNSRISLTEYSAASSEYIVKATYTNNGIVHFIPTRVKAAVVKGDGYGRTGTMLKCDDYGMFLPYETRYYTGVLNFSSLEPDQYNLEVVMEYPPNRTVRKQIRLRVLESDRRRIPEIINNDVKTSDLVEVKW